MTRAVVLAMILSSSASSAGGLEHARIKNFSVEQAEITEVAQKLSETATVRICVEEVMRPAHERPATGGGVESVLEPEPTFTLAMPDATVAEVLDEVVRMAPAYTWSTDETTSTINVYPRVDAALDWEVPDVVIEGVRAREVLASPDPLGLYSEHKIDINPGMGNMSWLETPLSLRARGLTARQALNKLLAQLHWEEMHCYRWELVQLPPGFRVRATVRLRWYGGDKGNIIPRASFLEAQSNPHGGIARKLRARIRAKELRALRIAQQVHQPELGSPHGLSTAVPTTTADGPAPDDQE